jgi:feruloyl-CoA synthase
LFAAARVDVTHRADGALLLRSPAALEPYARCVGEHLARWARADPDRLLFAERAEGGWRRLTFGEAYRQARAIGAGLLARNLSAERPVVILSDNSIDHALLALGAMQVGIPYAPVSPAYSLMSRDHGKLKAIFALLRPGLVFAEDGAKYAKALAAVADSKFEFVCSRDLPAGATAFTSLAASDDAVDAAFERITPDTIAKFLFTSGSTGEPKAVINTQRMLCANQQMIAQCWPFLTEEPPVIVDWLPWNHTFGSNHNFNMVLMHGGTMYIDEGKPAPGLFEKSVANLREVAPTLYFNVPRGFDALLNVLEKDAALTQKFFSRLKIAFYAGAALPQNLWTRMERLAQAQGSDVAMVSAWGSTETAPMVTCVHFPIPRAGVIGLPAPGCELLMVPDGGKHEMRVRGPNITPGYWKRPDLSAEAFDEQGFYKIGDAGKFADPDLPERGIEFDGRIAEDFKLGSGTWVHVGSLRVKAIAALAPVAQDIVIAGHDRAEIGLLIFASAPGCRLLCPDLSADTPLDALIGDARVRGHIRAGLAAMAREGGGSSTTARRALLMAEPAAIDANEITDKGYINQRAVLARRAALVEALFASPPGLDLILA